MHQAARTPPLSPITAAAFVLGMWLATRLPQLPPAWCIALLGVAGLIAWGRGAGAMRVLGAAALAMALLLLSLIHI